jgi:hypothetical protein
MSTLVELAARAESQPSSPGSGPYSYIRTSGTSGWPQTGSGRIEEIRGGRRRSRGRAARR